MYIKKNAMELKDMQANLAAVCAKPNLSLANGGLNISQLRALLLAQTKEDSHSLKGIHRSELITRLCKIKTDKILDKKANDTKKDKILNFVNQIDNEANDINVKLANYVKNIGLKARDERWVVRALRQLQDFTNPALLPECDRVDLLIKKKTVAVDSHTPDYTELRSGSEQCVPSVLQDLLFGVGGVIMRETRPLLHKCLGRWIDLSSLSKPTKIKKKSNVPKRGPEALFLKNEGYHIVSFSFDDLDHDRWWCFDSKRLVAHVRAELLSLGEGSWGVTDAEHNDLLARKRFPKITNPARIVYERDLQDKSRGPRRHLTREDVNRLWNHDQMRRFVKCALREGKLTSGDCSVAADLIEAQEKLHASRLHKNGNRIVARGDINREMELWYPGRLMNRMRDTMDHLPVFGKHGKFREIFTLSPGKWAMYLAVAQMMRLLTCAGVSLFALHRIGLLQDPEAIKRVLINQGMQILGSFVPIYTALADSFAQSFISKFLSDFIGPLSLFLRAIMGFFGAMMPTTMMTYKLKATQDIFWKVLENVTTMNMPKIENLWSLANLTAITNDLKNLVNHVLNELPWSKGAEFSPALLIVLLTLGGPTVLCGMVPIVIRVMTGIALSLRSILGGKKTDVDVVLLNQLQDTFTPKMDGETAYHNLCKEITNMILSVSSIFGVARIGLDFLNGLHTMTNLYLLKDGQDFNDIAFIQLCVKIEVDKASDMDMKKRGAETILQVMLTPEQKQQKINNMKRRDEHVVENAIKKKIVLDFLTPSVLKYFM
jgi:hypothetical protein